MNTRMRYLRRLFFGLDSDVLEYTWYINDSNTVTTEFYFGRKGKTNVPTAISGKSVTVLGCTTYTNDQSVREVIIPNNIVEIE